MATNGKEVAGQILSPAMQRPLIEGAEDIPKKSLVAKLAEACDQVGGVEKKGTNSQQNYKYVKAADVAMAIRHELFSRGIMLIPSESELIQERIETMKGGTMTEVRLKTTYKVTDGEQELSFDAWGIARDSGDKAVYKAKTGALKYFLRGLGLIPDETEPEADDSVDKPENQPRPRLSADKVQEKVEWIANASSLAELQTLYRNAYKEADAAGDKGAQSRFIKAKDARKAELQ